MSQFRIGKLFHLTPLVDELPAAELFFNSVFSPFCMMRGYAPLPLHRDAAIYVIGSASIEPMQCHGPGEGERGTSWYRYVQKNGPRVHNTAFYVDDTAALRQRFEQIGVRTTDGGMPGTVFAHPKDTPGMLEFSAPDHWRATDPRFSEHWDAFAADYWARHPLGLTRLSHITTVVHDQEAARKFFVDVLDAVALDDQAASVPDAEAGFVLVGEDTVMEVAHPTDPSSPLGQVLQTVGEVVTHVTFTVGDVDRAATFLERAPVDTASRTDHMIVLDAAQTWNTEFRFTDRVLAGDPRA